MTDLSCLLCVLRQTVDVAKEATEDVDLQYHIFREAMKVMGAVSFDTSLPELFQYMIKLITEITGNDDPYQEKKQKANIAALELYPLLKQEVAAADEKRRPSWKKSQHQ